MNILSPSILSADFKHLGADLQTIAGAGAEYVHIDVMDGQFVPSISYGMPVIKSIRSAVDTVFDVHLMIDEPIRYLQEFKDSGADIVTVHYEACSDVTATLRKIRELGMKAGLSIKPKTPVDVVDPYLEDCDMVLLMSVEPGFGGQKYIPESTGRAALLREKINRLSPGADLEIDGGVNMDNVEMILDAGVNVIVAGSAVFKNDAAANTRRFLEILKRHESIAWKSCEEIS